MAKKWQPTDRLMRDMRELAEKSGVDRVEVKIYDAPGGPHSVLFLPNLGWTAKNDLTTGSWADAYIVGHI